MTLTIRGAQAPSIRGSIPVAGSKNSTLPLLMASTAVVGRVYLENVPTRLLDVQSAFHLLERRGATIVVRGSQVTIETAAFESHAQAAGEDIRYSMLLLGAGLGRAGVAYAPTPGGCVLGPERPVDIHLAVLSKLGATVTRTLKGFKAVKRRPESSSVHLSFPSVGATENGLLYAAQQPRTIIIRNAAIEPEVLELAAFLSAAGADIRCDVVTRTFVVRGCHVLRAPKGVWRVSSDRIEAASYALLAAAHRSTVKLGGMNYVEFADLHRLLARIGCECTYAQSEEAVTVTGNQQATGAIKIVAGPYPEIATDLVPLLCAVAGTRRGRSLLRDGVFAARLRHVSELHKLGLQITKRGNTSIVTYSRCAMMRKAADADCADIRTGFALVIAASLRRSETRLMHEEQLRRGYECIEEKLRALGIHTC